MRYRFDRKRIHPMILVLWILMFTCGLTHIVVSETFAEDGKDGIRDLSLMVGSDYPCTWPQNWPYFQRNHYLRIGPSSAYNSDILTIDPNTATQIDFPPHSIGRPGRNLAPANQYGSFFADNLPAWKFGGEACVIDIRHLLDAAPKGVSPLVRQQHIKAWEAKHRQLGPGDVALLYAGYSDKYYKRMPDGRAFIADPLEKKRAAWPDPDPDCMDYIAKKGVHHIVVDSPSMGPIPDLQEPVHVAGLQHGAIFTESATGLGQLPSTGSFYWSSGPRHAVSPCTEARALAVTEEKLAAFLISATRKKQVIDLSVVLAADLPLQWPGHGVGRHRQAYYAPQVFYAKWIDVYHHTHMFDSNSGTHLVPPVFALPQSGFDNSQYAPQVQQWLSEYETKYGPRGTSNVTTEKVPLEQTTGWVRVIDVTGLVGSTNKGSWPASPEITVAHIQDYERKHGNVEPGQVVLFRSGHIQRTFKPGSEACMVQPLAGQSEGWPALGADAVMYLAKRQIRCVGTDAPSLGSVDEKQALFTYWALATQGLVGVEFLTNLKEVPAKSYFIFAATKIKGCHGGPGRAVAYY